MYVFKPHPLYIHGIKWVTLLKLVPMLNVNKEAAVCLLCSINSLVDIDVANWHNAAG